MTFWISKSRIYNNHFRISVSVSKHEAKNNVGFSILSWVHVLNDMVQEKIAFEERQCDLGTQSWHVT